MTNEQVSYTDLIAKLRAHSERDNCVSHDWGGEEHDAGEDCFAAANVIEQLMRDIEELTCGDPKLMSTAAEPREDSGLREAAESIKELIDSQHELNQGAKEVLYGNLDRLYLR